LYVFAPHVLNGNGFSDLRFALREDSFKVYTRMALT